MKRKLPVTPAAARAAMASRAVLELEASTLQNAPAVRNGLADAVGYTNGSLLVGTPGNVGYGAEQTSDAGTIFKNLRWYLLSNYRQALSEAYVEIGLIQTVVDVPVDDALRGGIEIKSKLLKEEEIDQLLLTIDRDDDLSTAGEAAKWNRLFGGAGIMIITDQDPEEPFDLRTLEKGDPLEFRAVDMWELYWSKQTVEGDRYEIDDADYDGPDNQCYDYYGEHVHRSRVLRLKGMVAPSFVRPRLRGWGVSVCEVLVRSINQYLKATSLGFEVLDEFKLDVYKIKNLVNTLLQPGGQQAIQKRVQLANWQKNYQNAVVMDSEDDFDHKQLSFAGLADAMAGIRMQVASDLRMPITKLFGQSVSSGIGNNDQNDMENYNSMVEGQVRNKLKHDIRRMVEIKCQVLFGTVPDDLAINFKPLRVLSAEQEENVKTQKFNRLLQAKERGELTTIEFRDACNKGGLFDVRLDTDEDQLDHEDDQLEDVLSGETQKEDADSKDDPPVKAGATANSGGGGKGGAGKRVNAEWDESKHKRAADGKFGEGGGTFSSAAAVPDDQVDDFIKDSDHIFAKVKNMPTLVKAVRNWTDNGYVGVRAIQSAKTHQAAEKDVKAGEAILAEFATSFDSLPAYEGPLTRDLYIGNDDRLVKQLFTVGDTFADPAYTSFTAREGFASSSTDVRLHVEKSTVGKCIWGLSSIPDEVEVIIPPKQRFKIARMEKDKKAIWHIYLEEVESE